MGEEALLLELEQEDAERHKQEQDATKKSAKKRKKKEKERQVKKMQEEKRIAEDMEEEEIREETEKERKREAGKKDARRKTYSRRYGRRGKTKKRGGSKGCHGEKRAATSRYFTKKGRGRDSPKARKGYSATTTKGANAAQKTSEGRSRAKEGFTTKRSREE